MFNSFSGLHPKSKENPKEKDVLLASQNYKGEKNAFARYLFAIMN